MNNFETRNNPTVCWIQMSSGNGPEECGWVVAKATQRFIEDACDHGFIAEMVESVNYTRRTKFENGCFQSTLVRLQGNSIEPFVASWVGSIKWYGQSPYRPNHKRMNWFIGVEKIFVPPRSELSRQKIQSETEVSTMRSRGPGGQHVNKTDSAVRVVHTPSGLSVRVDSHRSQHRNRELALERLLLVMQQNEQQGGANNKKSRWELHRNVERGAPTKIFHGIQFIEKN